MVTEGTAPTDGTTTPTGRAAAPLVPAGRDGHSHDGPSSSVPGAGISLVPGGADSDHVGPPAAPGDAAAHGDSAAPGDGAGAASGPSEDGGRRNELADRAASLFSRWCEDDVVASRELVRLLTPTLWHTARAYRLDGATAEDVVQNAWLALSRRRLQVRDPQAVLAWLLVTVRRDAARSAAHARTAVDDPEPLLAASPDPAPGPAATVVDDDRARRLWAAVGRLSERCQRLLRVVAFADRPDYATLSSDLGMPLGSIGPTRGRCLKKLRDHLGQEQEWTT